MTRPVQVIHNPAANQGQAARLLPELERTLKLYGDADLVQTTRPGEAQELTVSALAKGYEVIAAAGGDGTVNEIVNGFQDHQGGGPKPTLAILPIGSGNDLAWNIGIDSDLETACRRLFAGRQKLIDIGLIRDNQGHSRYFCNGVGIGFDGTIACEVQKVRWVGGFLKYLVGIARTFVLHYNAPLATLDFDGKKIAQDVMMLSICNGRRLGGGFLIAPEAVVDDGHLDICLVPRVGRLTILQMIPRFFRGTHVHDPRIRMDRGQHIGVDLEEGLAVHLDGEIFSESARCLRIEILPRSIGVLV